MRSIISFGALLTSSLFFVGNAEASPDHRCSSAAVASAMSQPAANRSAAQVTTSYSSAYRAAPSAPARVYKSTSRPKTFEDYRRQIKGW